jgi:putative lumazine-binding protein
MPHDELTLQTRETVTSDNGLIQRTVIIAQKYGRELQVMDRRQELQSLRNIPTGSRLCVLVVCSLICLLGGCSAKKDEAAVLVPVQAMFDGMAHRDAAAIKAPWLPGGVLVVVQDGVLSQLTVEFWANRVATSGTTHIEERIHDPEVRIDHDLAVVWAPFNFFIDGKLDHCGRDLFNLNQKSGRWQIVALAATTRKDCTAT